MATLIIGNKNYSSWSLRGWLCCRYAGIDFDEVVIPLQEEGFKEKILAHSPTGLVPCLETADGPVWDSLAIAEYAAENSVTGPVWPEDPVARAHARSLTAEMHNGFAALRTQMPMNIRARTDAVTPTGDTSADIARIEALWSQARARFGGDGPYLYGRLSLADAFYAPVASRLQTYGVLLGRQAAAYRDAILGEDNMQAWTAAAMAEPWVVDAYEI